MGRYDEAVELGMQAVRLDPYSPLAYNELAFAYWSAGQLDEAEAWFDRSLQIDPDFWQTTVLLPELYFELDKPELAFKYLDRIRDNIDDVLTLDIAYAAGTYVKLGRETDARVLLAHLEQRIADGKPMRAFAMVLIFNALAEYDSAMDWLEKAFEEGNLSLIWLKEDKGFEELRKLPRFQELLATLEFPE